MTVEQCGRKLRFHVPDLRAGLVALGPAETHHALHVLRVSAGESVELFDGAGGVAQGVIASASKREVSADVEKVMHHDRPKPIIHLAFAVPKGSRLDWLLEKATELGAASLRPVIFERSVAGGDELSENKRHRWLGHCVSAAKQSGLDYLPAIIEPMSLRDALPAAGGAFGLFGDLGPDTLRLSEALSAWAGREIWIVVGPEGGLTQTETAALREALFTPVRLGQTTLRIETAALAMLSATVAIVA